MTDELNTLFPDNSVELSDGSTLQVRPFTFGQLPKAISLSKELFGVARQMYEAEANTTELVGQMFAEGGESFIELIGLSINKPRAWFNELPADDGLKVATVFLEVNLSFFAQKVLPELKKGMSRLQKVAPGLTQ